jgi:hypothetical protein
MAASVVAGAHASEEAVDRQTQTALAPPSHPAQIGDGRQLAPRHNVDEDLVRFMRGFDARDIDATADYLSRLRGRGAVHRIMRNDGVVVD